MTREEAQLEAEDYLASIERSSPGSNLQILEDVTTEFTHGWVFHYQSKAFLESGDLSDRLAGNAPIIIDSRNGSIHETGTAERLEYYIQNYEVTGDPHIEAIPALVITGWREGAQKIEATRTINHWSSLGLVESKACIDNALGGISTTIAMGDFDSATGLQSSLESLGWIVAVIRESPNRVGGGN
ncbi:MAG: hypothetical protein SynsKO_44820 [Synoicihabitans sp.]